jgi:hypothetical protein
VIGKTRKGFFTKHFLTKDKQRPFFLVFRKKRPKNYILPVLMAVGTSISFLRFWVVGFTFIMNKRGEPQLHGQEHCGISSFEIVEIDYLLTDKPIVHWIA